MEEEDYPHGEVGGDIIPATLNSAPHFLMRWPLSEGKADFSLCRLKAGLDKEKKATIERERIWSERGSTIRAIQ